LLSGGTIIVPTIIAACSRGKEGHIAPSDRITLAGVGLNSRGNCDLKDLIKQKDVQLVALCDLDKNHLTDSKKFYRDYYKTRDIEGYTDYRELLEKEAIDAVMIAVPDHWHAILYTAFAEKKIDIYGEKPLVGKIEEGKKVVKAVRNYEIIFQTGSQQRSMKHF